MKRKSTGRLINALLAIPPIALTVGIMVVAVRRFAIAGEQWPIFLAGLTAVLVLTVLMVVFSPRWRQ